MTTIEAKSAARARVRAFLDARVSYGESLPPGVAAQSMTDVIASQARESGISRVEFSGSMVTDVETLTPGAYDDTLVRLLASDLALLTADDDESVLTLPNEAFDALVGTLDEPAKPVPELVNLFKQNRVAPTGDEG